MYISALSTLLTILLKNGLSLDSTTRPCVQYNETQMPSTWGNKESSHCMRSCNFIICIQASQIPLQTQHSVKTWQIS